MARIVIELTNRCNLSCQHCFEERHAAAHVSEWTYDLDGDEVDRCLAVIALLLWLLFNTFRRSSGRDVPRSRFAAGGIDAQRNINGGSKGCQKTKRAALVGSGPGD